MTVKERIAAIVQRPYSIEFEYGQSADEGVVAYVLEWPDCFAAGRTREDALAKLDRTMRELAAYRVRAGLDIPEPVSSFSGRLVLRLPRTLHRDAARRAAADGMSLNGWLVSAIAREIGPQRDVTGRR